MSNKQIFLKNISNVDASVIVVSWNTRSLLCQCLQSLIEHDTRYQMEIIVVDNASSDGTTEMVKEKFTQIKFIQNDTNLGFAKANNIGIKQCSGRYIACINSDIIVQKDCFDLMIDYMDKNSSIGIMGPKFYFPSFKPQYPCRRFPTLRSEFVTALGLNKIFPKSIKLQGSHLHFSAEDREKIQKVDVIAGAFWLVRRTAIQEVGVLDERFFFYGEDIDWCKRFWDGGWNVVYFPKAEAMHFHKASSSNDPVRFYIEQQKSKILYWKKHYSALEFIGILVAILLNQLNIIIVQSIIYMINKTKRETASIKIQCGIKCLLWFIRNCFISHKLT